jgi:NitT/TauT family transport system permease protein
MSLWLRCRAAVLGTVGVLSLGAVWETIKAIGGGNRFLGMSTDDASMPHLASVFRAFGDEDVRGSGRTVASAVLSGSWFSFRLAIGGFLLGTLVGLLLAMAMQRVKVLERAWMPYVVLSQTVPLIALAPLIVGWGSKLSLFGKPWQPWMSVIGMAAYLSFFPVTIGALRGLQSPKPQSLELMDSYAAGWWQTTTKLRLPSAVPHLIPALKLAAAASVVGAIVAEISSGTPGGIGRLIIEYFQKASGEPERVFTAFVGAALLGLVVAGLVSVIERIITRKRASGVLS